MSRGLGSLQRQVLRFVASLNNGDGCYLYALKKEVFGVREYVTRGIKDGRYTGNDREHRKLACSSSQAASLNRAIDALVERGLMTDTLEQVWRFSSEMRRWIAITPAGLEVVKRIQQEVCT
jgi:hypothetical protein